MLFALTYGIGAAAFLALIALMLINRRPQSFGWGVLLACAITALWAVAAAMQSWWMSGIAHALESLRNVAWLTIVALTLYSARKTESGKQEGVWLPVFAGGIGLASFANDCRFLFGTDAAITFAASQVLARVLVSVSGILLVENLYRNVSPGRRWNVMPLCIALGAMFAYDLFLFCEAVILKSISPPLLAARGIVLAFIVPLLVLTMARNPGWNIDIHVSRRVVFHGATLTAAGVFLLVAAAVAGLIGRFPGEWASVSEIVFFCGSVILLSVALSTESIRSRLRRLIAENFFSTRYDYRVEWLRTIATLSSAGANEPLAVRAIRAVADMVDSPGGVLWLEDETGNYRVAQVLAMSFDLTAVESASGDFVAGFQGGEAVQVMNDASANLPTWAEGRAVWLGVPLVKIDRLIGFVILARSRAPAALNWESTALLLAIGQQIAGYLEEERATRALVDSQALIDYSRRFSFVIHDIKNVSGQLGLMIANISRFGDRAEFRADMIRGLESAAGKLQRLVDRLRPDAPATDESEVTDPAEVVSDTVRELNGGHAPVCASIAGNTALVKIAPTDLRAVLTHLITNAVEASLPGDEVTVRLGHVHGKVAIEVADKGAGMSADFIRNNLFVPMRSTKARGHGMGAYQARHLVRSAGGELEVVSAVGRGTVMRILLPKLGEIATPEREELVS